MRSRRILIVLMVVALEVLAVGGVVVATELPESPPEEGPSWDELVAVHQSQGVDLSEELANRVCGRHRAAVASGARTDWEAAFGALEDLTYDAIEGREDDGDFVDRASAAIYAVLEVRCPEAYADILTSHFDPQPSSTPSAAAD